MNVLTKLSKWVANIQDCTADNFYVAMSLKYLPLSLLNLESGFSASLAYVA